MIKAIVFDFFGVIITTDPYTKWLQENIVDIEKRRSEFQAISDRGDRGETNYEQFLEEVAKKAGVSKEEALRINDNIHVNYPLIDYIIQLRKDYKTGILTNSTEDWVNLLLARHGLYEYFDEVIISSSLGIIKPQPAIFEHALAILQTKPAETVYIDDRQVHVDAAKLLGIHGILFENMEQLRREIKAIQK